MAQPIPSPDTSLPKPEAKAGQPQAKPPNLVEMNRLKGEFDIARSGHDRARSFLRTAQNIRTGNSGGTLLDEIGKLAANVRDSNEISLNKELPYREAETALLISEVGSPATDQDVVNAVNALEHNQTLGVDDPALVEVNRRKQAGKSLTEIKIQAQVSLDAREQRAEMIRIAESMKSPGSARRLGTVDMETTIRNRINAGETPDDIIAKVRTDQSRYDEVENKKRQLAQTLKRIEEIKSAKQAIARLKQGGQELAAQQQIQQVRSELEGLTGKKDEETRDPKADINIWRNKFLELKNAGTVDKVIEGMVENSMWQQITYGKGTKPENEQLYRGYLMVEPENFPLALEILSNTAEQRKVQGKTTEFKWLLKTEEPGWTDRMANGQSKPKEIGEYPYLRPEDPRIALYGDGPQDIQEVISALAKHPQWQTIEASRIKALAGKAPRRPGSNSFIDTSGHEWRTLNYNNKPGYSEDEAKNPQWRDLKAGTPTGNL